MKIGFIALNETFDFNQIGGTDSYMRRLSISLVEKGHKIDWLFYNSEINSIENKKGISIIRYKKFSDLKNYILNIKYEKLIICYIMPTERIRIFFIKLLNRRLQFYNLIFFYPDTLLKKLIRLIEIKFNQYKGVITVSKRSFKFYNNFCKNTILIYPIIPNKYFEIGRERIANKLVKVKEKKLPVIFIGRLDPKKGINTVLKLIHDKDLKEIIDWTISGIIIDTDEGNIDARNKLKKIKDINFIFNKRSKYSIQIEKKVCELLKKNIIFIQPYENLLTTVDLPLLILEAQAAGCILLTTLPEILNSYLIGDSKAFSNNFEKNAKTFIKNYNNQKNKKLNLKKFNEFQFNFSDITITNKFINYLEKN